MKDYKQSFTTPYYDDLKRGGVKLPCFLTHIRTDQARIEKPKDARMFRMMFLTPRADGWSGTLDTRPLSNLILTRNQNIPSMPTYNPNPTKEDLLEYFRHRIRVRKMTPREAFRLMDVDDTDIDKTENANETVTLKNGTVKTRRAVSKTAMYKLAGNSIVVACLCHIFESLLFPPKNKPYLKQYDIFDYLQDPPQ